MCQCAQAHAYIALSLRASAARGVAGREQRRSGGLLPLGGLQLVKVLYGAIGMGTADTNRPLFFLPTRRAEVSIGG